MPFQLHVSWVMKEKSEVLFNHLEMVPHTLQDEDNTKTGSVWADVTEYYKNIPRSSTNDRERSLRCVSQSKVQVMQHHLYVLRVSPRKLFSAPVSILQWWGCRCTLPLVWFWFCFVLFYTDIGDLNSVAVACIANCLTNSHHPAWESFHYQNSSNLWVWALGCMSSPCFHVIFHTETKGTNPVFHSQLCFFPVLWP